MHVSCLILLESAVLGTERFVCKGHRGGRSIRTCTLAMVAGSWAYTETGTLYLPSGPVLLAIIGNYTIDASGNLLGARTSSMGGTIGTATIKGTATVNSDCTGRVELNFYSQGKLVNTAEKNVVYLNYATEARAIITSVHLPDGSSASAVMTTDAKKVPRNAAVSATPPPREADLTSFRALQKHFERVNKAGVWVHTRLLPYMQP
jgi:hypothetical protein